MCSLTVDRDASSSSARLATFVSSTSAFIIEGNDAQRRSAVCICFINMFEKGAETPADLTSMRNETSSQSKHSRYTFIYDHTYTWLMAQAGCGISVLGSSGSPVSDLCQVTRLVLRLQSLSLQKHLIIEGKPWMLYLAFDHSHSNAGKFQRCYNVSNFFTCELWHVWHRFKLSITQQHLQPKFMQSIFKSNWTEN